MGTGIYENPNDYEFGLDFDYSLWTPNTVIDLVNVTWNNDYRDVARFDNRSALDAYINTRRSTGLTIDRLSYVKPNEPVRLNIPFNKAIKYNYLRASNPAQPIMPNDEQRNFYYFILDVKYVAPNTTELVLQLDVWSTYIYDLTIGRCYVERGHIAIANSKAFDSFGRDYLTVPEGLDVGAQPQVITQKTKWILSPTPDGAISERYPSYDVLVVSTVDLEADPGTIEAPNLVSAKGGNFQGTIHGANFYVFEAQAFTYFMTAMSEKPWVTQGIVSITMIPKIVNYHPGFEYNDTFEVGAKGPVNPPVNRAHQIFPDWRNSNEIWEHIPKRYHHLRKFMVFPYMLIEMTTFNGTPVVLKPEVWNNGDATIAERVSFVPPAQRVEFIPRWYNSRFDDTADVDDLWPGLVAPYNTVKGDDYGEWLDVITQIANFPTMAIVNNGAISYLASNTHGIAFQRTSNDWSQSRALGMSQGQYDIASQQMTTAENLAGISNAANTAMVGTNNRLAAGQAIVSGIGGLVGGAGSGAVFGPVGMAAGAVSGVANGVTNGINTALQIGANDENLATSIAEVNQKVAANNTQTGFVRDTNKRLADWGARGDYANTIAGINAKIQDSALIQPTTSGQVGGEAMNIVNGGLCVSLRWKGLDAATMTIIGEYWLRYGYAVRASIVPPANLMAMSKFTYWKMLETYIIASNVPEGFKQIIRGILEKGVTVWRNPDDIGVIDWANNDPLGGISY